MNGEQFLVEVRGFTDALTSPNMDIVHPDFPNGVSVVGAGKAEVWDAHVAAIVARTSVGMRAFVFRAGINSLTEKMDIAEIAEPNISPFGMRYDARPSFSVDMTTTPEAFSRLGTLVVPACMNISARVFAPLMNIPARSSR